MIVCLLGKAGEGKTTVAEALEQLTPDSFIIDGDDLRAETKNTDIGLNGRENNMRLGFSRARWLSDLGFTVFVAMQAPIKEIRDEYLSEDDIEIVLNNTGHNPKEELGYNKNFSADYSGVDYTIDFNYEDFIKDDTEIQKIIDLIFPKVLVIARFQGMHRGHKIILETAKRLSPNITIGLRADEGDLLDLDKNILLLEGMGYNVVKTPDIDEPEKHWEDFVLNYDIIVQGNPVVIKKFQKCIDSKKIRLKFVPRIGHVSATKIRAAIARGDEKYAKQYVNQEVVNFLKESIGGVATSTDSSNK